MMKITGFPLGLTPKVISTNTSISHRDLNRWNRAVVTNPGTVLTLEAAAKSFEGFGFNCVNVSEQGGTRGDVFVFSPNSTTGWETWVVRPNEEIRFECVNANSTYQWMAYPNNSTIYPTVWSPTLTWTTGTPTSAVCTAYWCLLEGTVFFNIKITSADGNGATDLTITLPVGAEPADINTYTPCVSKWRVGAGAEVDALAYVEQTTGTLTSRLIQFRNPQTCTDNSALEINVSGFYEVYGWETWSPTSTWTTGTPGSITAVSRWKQIGNNIFFVWQAESADSNAASQVTTTLPTIVTDRNIYLSVASYEKAGAGGATFYNPQMYIDALNNTAESRLLTCSNMTAGTDSQAIGMYAAGFYEAPGKRWQTFTPSCTFTTATPASITKVGLMDTFGPIGLVAFYATSADGNGATALVVANPFPAKKACLKVPLAGYQIVNTSKSDPAAFLDANNTDWDDRTLEFDNLSTWTDAQTTSVWCSGWTFI